MATVLFIVYQFTFVAELGETNSKAQERGKHVPNPEASNRKHPRDLNYREAARIAAKNTGKEKLGDGEEERQGGKRTQGDSEQHGQEVHKPEHLQQNMLQKPKLSKPNHSSLTFKCETTGRQISVDKINDNYCDCPEDGSDEPRTNACANGRFMCLKHAKSFPESIPSGWVNDGVCDCCDGSDEWKMKSVPDLAVSLQKKIGRYLSPCPNQCPAAE